MAGKVAKPVVCMVFMSWSVWMVDLLVSTMLFLTESVLAFGCMGMRKAARVVDSLNRGMILSGDVLVFGWMSTQRAIIRAGLLAVSLIPWMVR